MKLAKNCSDVKLFTSTRSIAASEGTLNPGGKGVRGRGGGRGMEGGRRGGGGKKRGRSGGGDGEVEEDRGGMKKRCSRRSRPPKGNLASHILLVHSTLENIFL